jgi:hypothetical protein
MFQFLTQSGYIMQVIRKSMTLCLGYSNGVIKHRVLVEEGTDLK